MNNCGLQYNNTTEHWEFNFGCYKDANIPVKSACYIIKTL